MSETSAETILRLDLNAMESEVLEDFLDYGIENDHYYDDGLVIQDVDEETKQEIIDHCYERAREAGDRGDYKAAEWCKNAGSKVEQAEIEVLA